MGVVFGVVVVFVWDFVGCFVFIFLFFVFLVLVFWVWCEGRVWFGGVVFFLFICLVFGVDCVEDWVVCGCCYCLGLLCFGWDGFVCLMSFVLVVVSVEFFFVVVFVVFCVFGFVD